MGYNTSCQIFKDRLKEIVHTFLMRESIYIMDEEWLEGASSSGTSLTVTQVHLELVMDTTQAFLLLELLLRVSVQEAGPLLATVLVGKVLVSYILYT